MAISLYALNRDVRCAAWLLLVAAERGDNCLYGGW